jgi:hypothetical protein
MIKMTTSKVLTVLILIFTLLLIIFHLRQSALQFEKDRARLESIQILLNDRISDRWRRTDAKNVWHALFAANPDLKVPPNIEELINDPKDEEPIILTRP